MKKHKKQKQQGLKKVRKVNFVLRDNRYRLSLVTKDGIKDPFLITNNFDEAVNKYLDKCEQYGLTPDVALIYKLKDS